MKKLFPKHDADHPVRTAILMSGSGSNTEAILQYCRENACAFVPVLIATDTPQSRAAEIAQNYDLPCELLDIRKFYAEHGEENIRLDTPQKQALRQEWSELLFQTLSRYDVGLILLAGFIPLTNLTEKLPCLNVHPGDLTVTDPDGRRLYAGLHYRPVEDALCNGEKYLRSSVILAQPYSGSGREEMDTGPVIGVSPRIPVDLSQERRTRLIETGKQRLAGKIPCDALRREAQKYIEQLKILGDHLIFARAADDFARGRFACGDDGGLLFETDTGFQPVISVEYSNRGSRPLERPVK